MKKISLLLLVLMYCFVNTYGQTSGDIICAFTKKDNGNIFTKNEDGSRYVNFQITGIALDEQAVALRQNVKLNGFVQEFTISEETKEGIRLAYMSIAKGTKVDVLWNLLLNNGIKYIKLNNQIQQVTALKAKKGKKN